MPTNVKVPGSRLSHAWVVLAMLLGPGLTPPADAQSKFGDSRCTLGGSTEFAAGTNPFSVDAADINNDGKPDIAVANEGSNNVSILLGTGTGAFAAPIQVAVGTAPRGVALGDLNADGKRDLVAANSGSNTISVWFGSGTGNFVSPATLAVGVAPRAVAIRDLDADGKPDLVVVNANSNSVSVLMATGGGAFASATSYAVGVNPSAVAIADFNADAKLDLAVANEGSGTVSILLGNGLGGFGSAGSFAAGSQLRAIVAADFSGDGKPDAAVASWNTAEVLVLLGTGSGTLGAATSYPVPSLPTGLASVDFDADGQPELAVANETSLPNIITMLRGLAGGAFSAPASVSVGGIRPRAVAFADFNTDGKPDLVVADYSSNNVSILLGDCALAMNIAPSVNVDATSSYQLRKSPIWFDWSVANKYTVVVVPADLNRDGWTDLVRASITSGQTTPVQVLMNAGDNIFVDRTATMISNVHPDMVYPRKGLRGDYNGDGWPDVLILGTGLDQPPFPGEFSHLYLSNGDGTLHYSPALEPYVEYNHGGASADIDGNGTIDVVMSNSATFSGSARPVGPHFLINDGLGNFVNNTNRLPIELHVNGIYTMELVDIDQDGFIDLFCAGNEFSQGDVAATIYWGSSSGLYRSFAKTDLPKPAGNGGVLDFAAEDIDHDGRRDVIISRFADNFAVNNRYFQILRQVSPRQFSDETASRITMNTNLESFAFLRVQDINGDGSPDLFADNKYFASVGEYAWTNNGAGVFAPYSGPVNPVDPVPALSVTDASVTEGNSGSKQLNFTVSLSNPALTAVSFDAYTDTGTATPGVDYQSNAVISQTIAAGQTSTSFPVIVNGDTEVEGHETFTVNLANVLGARLGARLRDGQALGRIVNDDLAQLSIGDVTVIEGNSGWTTATFVVQLSEPMPSPVTFDIATSNGTATAGSDYVARNQTGRYLDSGRTRLVFEVAINGDTSVEPDETFAVTISNVSGATLTRGSAVGTISNDDGVALRASASPPHARRRRH